jgi:hypothetical protein
VEFNCVKKTARKTELNVLWHSTGFPSGLPVFVISVCLQVAICTLQWTQGSHRFYSFWKVECLEMVPSWRRQVNWGNCGIPWVTCVVLCAKVDWKGQFWVFPSGITSHSKIAQFNLQCIRRFKLRLFHELLLPFFSLTDLTWQMRLWFAVYVQDAVRISRRHAVKW